MPYENTLTGIFGLHISDLRGEYPNVSIPDGTEAFGTYRWYDNTPPPEVDYKHNLIEDYPLDGKQQWHLVDAAEEQIAARFDAQATIVRADRATLLAACDWTQLEDSGLTSEQVANWRVYRRELRDISKQPGFPFEVVWPVAPTEQK